MRRDVLLLFAVALVGCSRSSYRLAPVSGLVTMDAKPLANVHVTFAPLGSKDNINPGPGSHGLTDAEGRFVLTATRGKRGAVVGKHRVSIEAAQEGESASGQAEQPDGAESEAAMRRRLAASLDAIPARYNRQSTLTFDVPPSGTTQADFALTK